MCVEHQVVFQFCQIILAAASLGLECHSMIIDNAWNKQLDRPLRIPNVDLMVCARMLLAKEPNSFHKYILNDLYADENYWSSANTRTVRFPRSQEQAQLERLFYARSIKREGVEERLTIGLLTITMILLVGHFALTCFSKRYEYRTKWSAAVQLIVFFAAGMAGVLLAISMYDYDRKYQVLAEKYKECIPLILCTCPKCVKDTVKKNLLQKIGINSKKDNMTILEHLEEQNACQNFGEKNAAAIICIVVMCLSAIIICNAMDLATIYDEEDVDEEERARRQVFLIQALHAKRKIRRKQSQSQEDLKEVTVRSTKVKAKPGDQVKSAKAQKKLITQKKNTRV